MLGFGGDVASTEHASSPPWRRWEPRGSAPRIPGVGGPTLPPPCPGRGVGLAAGEVRVRPSRLGILRFRFPVPAWLLAGLSFRCSRAAGSAQGCCRGISTVEMCWMVGKSHGTVSSLLACKGQTASGAQGIIPVRGDLLLCLRVPGPGCPGHPLVFLVPFGPPTELQGFALQPPLLSPFPPRAGSEQGFWGDGVR